MLLASIRLRVKREINHIFHGSSAVSSTPFLGFLLLRISEIFDATCHFKKMMGLQNFLNRAEFLSQHSKDYFQILEILYVCNTFVEIGDLCFVLFFNDEDRGCVLFCA